MKNSLKQYKEDLKQEVKTISMKQFIKLHKKHKELLKEKYKRFSSKQNQKNLSIFHKIIKDYEINDIELERELFGDYFTYEERRKEK